MKKLIKRLRRWLRGARPLPPPPKHPRRDHEIAPGPRSAPRPARLRNEWTDYSDE